MAFGENNSGSDLADEQLINKSPGRIARDFFSGENGYDQVLRIDRLRSYSVEEDLIFPAL